MKRLHEQVSNSNVTDEDIFEFEHDAYHADDSKVETSLHSSSSVQTHLGEEEEEQNVDRVLSVDEKATKFRENFSHYEIFAAYQGPNPLHRAIAASRQLCKNAGLDGYELPVFGLDNPIRKDENGKEIRTGAKRYIVTSYQMFVKQLLRMEESKRCFYETMESGEHSQCSCHSHGACHLHIDAEMFYDTNKESPSTVWLENELLSTVKEKAVDFKYVVDPEKELEIITLDASNQKKFSRHYIIKIKGKVFRNSYHVGSFMRHVERSILEKHGKDVATNPFYMWSENEKTFVFDARTINKVSFMDMTIYNEFRQFRTVGSVKAGEKDYANRSLKPLGTNASQLKNPETILSTLILRVAAGSQIIQCMEINGSKPRSRGNSRADRRSRAGLVNQEQQSITNGDVIMNENSSSNIVDAQGNRIVGDSSNGDVPFSSLFHQDPDSLMKNELALVESQQKDQFISFSSLVDLISKEIAERYPYCLPLHNRGYNQEQKMFVLDSRHSSVRGMMDDNNDNMCQIHGYAHRSNRIYFIISFKYGNWWQKCFKDQSLTTVKNKLSSDTLASIKKYLDQQDQTLCGPKVVEEILTLLNYRDTIKLS